MLCALVERWRYGNRSLLHREDFVFETQVGRSSRSKGFEDPSQFPLLGFKDRNLESRYLDDLVKVSKTRIGLGYGISLLLVTIMPFTYTMGSVVPLHVLGALPRYGDRDIWLPTLALAVFVIGLAASIGLYRFKRHQAVLFVTEATFLSYIVVMGYFFSEATGGWRQLFGPSGWVFHLTFMEFPAFLTLFFWNLPFVLTTEIIGLALAVFMVIVPLCGHFWDNEYTSQAIQEQIEVSLIHCSKFLYVILPDILFHILSLKEAPFYASHCAYSEEAFELCERNILFKFTFPFVILGIMVSNITERDADTTLVQLID